ncbi:MMPL family transporter [Streptomyces rubellomurinus]|uniref:Membrane protein n=2 Tax=Streptomyces TaxID=1883 RepID=A0A0F2TCL6_STRR3|nr:MMPL family transporter [Streptomyces rubellomurinus]KJS54051.1 membrane protein [Streptomyces rubellomurinus subsp. indigoferus]KJS60246.1 membrane protein [Streptomyces rubellomurinus]
MATFLYRLGRWAFARRKLVTLLWVAVLAVCGVLAAKAPAAPDDGFAMPGTEAQQAFDLMNERFPGGHADGASARLVFVAPDGQKITAAPNQQAVQRTVAELAHAEQVTGAVDPFQAHAVSKDGTTAYATVSYSVKAGKLSDGATAALEQAAQHGRDAGLKVEVGGTALMAKPEAGGSSEAIGMALSAVVLVITFGSLVAAGLPLLTAVVGVGLGMSLITALGSTLGLSSTTGTLAMMLGLAVGIDYAVFIVSRYRAELAEGREPLEAAGRAVGTAGSAVVFAGLTVVIALAGLSVVGIPMLAKMGMAAAGTVVIAVLVALTLVPALLGFIGRRVLPRKVRKAAEGAARPTGDNGGARWARFVLRRPLAVLLGGVIALGVLAAPALDLNLGLPGDEAKPTSTTQRRAYDLLSDGFGPGFNGPLTVLVDAKGAPDPKAAASEVAKTVSGLPGVVTVTPPMFNKAGDTALVNAIPATGPSDAATKDLVHTIRGHAAGLKTATGATVLVSGTTAMNIDVSQKLSDALLPYLGVVVGLAVLLLLLVFRSVLVPLKAALGFLLSVAAALGAVVAVFQWGWLADLIGVQQTGPVMSMMPIFMIGVVFGLAMDYEVFLVTRIREGFVHGESPGEAIVTGFRHNARVVTAAAFIMIAVFAGFIGMSEPMIKMMGLGLAAAVAFDAFVVRMTIVPAVLALLGRRAWWLPRWLDRALPDVDVEGSKLHTAAPEPEPVREPVTV